MQNDKCWLWTGARNSCGYAEIRRDGKNYKVHRIMFEMFKGTIKKGLEIDHICRVRNCVNPKHLRAVTHRINMLCGDGVGSENFKKTKCPRGHKYNRVRKVTRKNGLKQSCRYCSICQNKQQLDCYYRKQAHFKSKGGV